MRYHVIGIGAAFAGATIGYFGVGVIAQQGFHAIVLPAALPGLLVGLISRERSIWWASLYALFGLCAALFTEWKYRPFAADSSFGYFVRHLGSLQSAVIAIIAVGAILGGVLSINLGRNRETASKATKA